MHTMLLLLSIILTQVSNISGSEPVDAGKIRLEERLPMDSAFVYGKFENGLTYYIRKNKKPENRAELRLVINAGSILENDQQQGLAHFVEHMAFNGTESFAKQEIVDYLESIGMRFGPDINAYTSFDETVYMLQIPTDSLDIINKGFQILSEWAHRIAFSDTEIDKERGVVVEEWRLGRGASSRMLDKQLPILLYNSRYAERLPIGKKTVLDTFQHGELRDFYRNWYRPDLMAVIAVGDFDPPLIEKLIRENFIQIKNIVDPPERVIYEVPDHIETLYAIASDSEATYSRINIYHKLPLEENRTTWAYREHLVERLYNRMLNERLSELTREENPPFIYAASREGRMIRSKNFYILSAIVEDNGILRGFESLLTEALRVQKYGFTETELERHKKAILRSREQQFNERDKTESSRYAAQCVGNFLYENPIPDVAFQYDLDKRFLPEIRLDEVNDLAKKWLTEGNRVILADSPEKEGIHIPSNLELETIINLVKSKSIDPYIDEFIDQPLLDTELQPKEIVAENYFADLDVTEWILENGIRVVLKPTDFKNDEIRFSAFSPGGNSIVADSNLIAAESATGIIRESGLGAFNQTQLQKYLSGKIVRVWPYIGELSEGFSGFASPKDLKTLFELVYLNSTAVREDSIAFSAFRDRLLGIYQNRSANPEAAFQDSLTATLTQNHIRFRPWSTETLHHLNLRKSIEIFRNRFADASDFTFLFVGNFQPDSIKPLIKTYLGSLPVLNRNETWENKTYRYPKGIIKKEVYKGKEPKSKTSIVITGPFSWERRERYLCNSMLDALRIKLRERLREEMSGTYSINVYGSYVQFPIQRYRITFQFGSDPARVDELCSEIFTQIDSLKVFGTTAVYLNKVKESQLRAYETNLKENEFWIANLEFKYFHQEPLNDILTYGELVNTLTLEDIQDAAIKYLNTDNYVRVVLFPEKE